jgi:hypothetical protein
LFGLGVLLLVMGLAWAWHWRTHPTVFPEHGNGLGSTLGDGRRMLAVGVTFPYPGTGERVSIESAEPRVVENSAGASFEFYVCSLDPEHSDGSAIGSISSRVFSKLCPDAIPVTDGTELDVGAAIPQQLVMVLTVQESGMVVTEGVDLTYSSGWQSGTQAIGTHMRIKSRLT